MAGPPCETCAREVSWNDLIALGIVSADAPRKRLPRPLRARQQPCGKYCLGAKEHDQCLTGTALLLHLCFLAACYIPALMERLQEPFDLVDALEASVASPVLWSAQCSPVLLASGSLWCQQLEADTSGAFGVGPSPEREPRPVAFWRPLHWAESRRRLPHFSFEGLRSARQSPRA